MTDTEFWIEIRRAERKEQMEDSVRNALAAAINIDNAGIDPEKLITELRSRGWTFEEPY